MKWILFVVVPLMILFAIVFGIGFALPAHTAHKRTISLKQSPDKVFALLADLPGMAKWNRNTEKIEVLSPVNGKETTQQTFKGGMVMVVTTTESFAPNRLVRSLGDARAPFSGSWTYQITGTPNGGSQVELSEESDIAKPLYRFMVKLFGATKYLDEHLEDLAGQFGEKVTIS